MPILTVTLNPAVDLATDCDELIANTKLRCAPPSVDPGGGGVNVSRAISILGGESKALLAQGGATGEHLLALLKHEGIDVAAQRIQGATRQSFSVTARDTQEQYRFVLPGPEWSEHEADAFVELALSETQAGDCVVASGSLPPGLRPSFYADLASELQKAGRRVILDTSGPPLQSIVRQTPTEDRHAPCGLRMNKPEAASVASRPLDSRSAIESFGRQLVSDGVAQVVAIADGGNGAYFFDADAHHFVEAPEVERRSAIGAGDSFVAALTLGLHRRWDLGDIGRSAVAAASAALTTPATELCDRATAEQLFGQLKAETSPTS